MTTLYRKEGRRYVPVAEHDPMTFDAMPEGTHLVKVAPGSRHTCMHIQPAHAAVLACILTHRDKLARAIHEGSAIKRFTPKLTRREARAWKAYTEIAGADMLTVSKPGAHEIIDTLRDLIVAHVDKA